MAILTVGNLIWHRPQARRRRRLRRWAQAGQGLRAERHPLRWRLSARLVGSRLVYKSRGRTATVERERERKHGLRPPLRLSGRAGSVACASELKPLEVRSARECGAALERESHEREVTQGFRASVCLCTALILKEKNKPPRGPCDTTFTPHTTMVACEMCIVACVWLHV